MKVWARYAVPVMVLVDEAQDSIERIVMWGHGVTHFRRCFLLH